MGMKKKALKKDFYVEIRRSIGRFLSIFFIVAIGCAFFSGIRASEPDMLYSGDAYFDRKNLMDIQVISTMGLTEEDLQAIDGVKGIEAVEGGYSVDVLCGDRGNQVVVHVLGMLENMNQIQLEEGRLPVSEDECVLDVDFLHNRDLKIGDELTFSSGTNQELNDTLKYDTYRIVGAVSSPNYISFQRGNTTIGNGSVAAFAYVKPDAFTLDVFTEIYAKVEGAKELTAFTPEYEKQVKTVLDRVEAIRAGRELTRQEEIKEEANAQIVEAETEISTAEKELEDGKAKAESELERARNQLGEARKELDQGWNVFSQSWEELKANRQLLQEKQAQLDNGKKELSAQVDTLNTQSEQLTALKTQYEQLKASGKTDPQTLAILQVMSQKIQEGDAAIAQAQAQIDAANKQFVDAQKQIDDGYAKANEGEQQLYTAEAELNQGEEEIKSGWSTYYEEEEKANAEIEEGEQKLVEAKEKLADAKKKVADIERPEWYVYDRTNLPDYSGYGENADRMRAIGQVFPVIFFLVAALISLTTMTRMVEEQRTQIGTLKALGYERHSIAGKYLSYALIATLTGGVLGVLVGEKIFPYIIITAYNIMFKHMHELVLPYNVEHGVWAVVVALFCTLLATFLSISKELKEQAAELMRPPTPKQGQRVLLERVKFIWKRLNFTWKASVRNLVRYKKRFFMTIFGIGGCMGLMIVGFGLKDSIFAVADIQYGEIQMYDGTVVLTEHASEDEKQAVMDLLKLEKKATGSMEGIFTQVSVGNAKLSETDSGVKWKDVYLDVPKNPKKFQEFMILKDRMTDETYQLSDEGVILTEKMARELEVEVGDTMVIRKEGLEDVSVKIQAICENYMGHYLYMTPRYYESVYGEAPTYNAVYYKTKDRTTQEAQQIGEDVLKLPGTLSVSYTTDMRQRVDDMLSALDIVIVVLTISAGMLAFVVLYNLNNINITERKRELATLKVLGFYNKEISAYVYRENIVLTLLGSLFGVFIGKILHRFIIVTVEIDAVMFGRNVDVSSFVYSFLLTIAFSFLVNGAMYFKLKKIDMVESLKSVE